eukprot:CAMPEP_0119282092 /NCGR_PEP_ID=MMETSP1329-20130426/26062_1 /TAXON_ID=114041 /ORGANISM="Genus nov. species nov., Strain RCC1024" /LENGTH=46 /DNA_ID= /DNA_START= /DNA_END= /DNA_ORIENTATION=
MSTSEVLGAALLTQRGRQNLLSLNCARIIHPVQPPHQHEVSLVDDQ